MVVVVERRRAAGTSRAWALRCNSTANAHVGVSSIIWPTPHPSQHLTDANLAVRVQFGGKHIL